MTDHPFPAISNPQITTTGMYAGDIIINLRELLTDIDLSPLFEGWRPIIKTQFLFRSGKIAMTDPDLSNEVHIVVDDFINHTGNVNLHIPFFSDDDDTLVLENHPTVINNKVLGTGISASDDIDFNGNAILDAVIDGVSNTLTNIPKSALPSTAVYTDQANTFGVGFNQSFRHTRLLLWNPASTFRYIFNAGAITADRNVTIPLISADDTFALKGIDNVFTESQTIQKDTQDLLGLYRTTSTNSSSIGLTFDAQSSTGTKRTYARIRTRIEDNTNASEDGNIYFDIMSSGSIATRFIMHGNGNFFAGPANQLVLTWNGLTSQRVFSFPDVTTKLAGEAWANEFTAKQKISYSGGSDTLILNRDSNALGTQAGIYFKADDSANNETTYAYLTGGIGGTSGDNTDGAENGQFNLGLKVAGADVTKLNITKNQFNTYGVVPRIEVGSGDFQSFYIYRPINANASNIITFEMQNSVNSRAQYGYIGARSEVLTSGSTTGSLQFGAVEAGSLVLQAKIHSYQTYLYNSSSLAAILDPTGLSSNRVYTFPDQAGQITLNAATQVLSNKTVSSGWTITGDVAVNNASGLHITKNAGSSVAEVLMRLDMADNGTSYLTIDNATTLDGQFIPRITAYHSSAGSSGPGFYLYSNILGANDTGTTNGVIVLDSRRVEGAALTSRPILDVRNFTTNLFRVFPTYIASHLPVTISPVSGTGDFETLMTLQPSDSPSCSMLLQNGTSTNTVFTPLFTTQVLAAASASTHTNVYFRNIILAANDTGSIPLMSVEGRRSDVTAITTRPIFSIKNLNTDLYLFYPTHLDLTNHFIEIEEIAAPSNPPANHLRIWMDNGDETLKIKNSAGTVTTIGSGGATAIDQLTDVDTSTTPPTDNQVLTWNNTSSQWVPATPPGASGGEANLGANVGTGVGEVFRDKSGVTLNFKRLAEGNGIDLTNNADDISIALGTSITLPAGVGSMITFTKPNSGASGAERLMRWIVDDDPNGSELTIENLTGNQNIFAPGFIFSQYSTATIPSAIILGRIAVANDVVNTTPAISLNARQPTAAIANRPLFGVQNYTDAYDFMVYKDKIDFGGNSLQNATVSSSVTGIVDANIDSHTSTKITISAKGQLPSTIAYEDEANSFSAQQGISLDSSLPFWIRRPNNTVGSVVAAYYVEMRNSSSANTNYAKIETRIGTNTAGNETGFMDFWVRKNGTMGQYMILDGNQLSLGLSGARAVLDSSNINTTSKTFNFPNLSGQLVTQEFANVFSAIQKVSVNTQYPLTITKPINTQFTSVGIAFNMLDSDSVEQTYAGIWTSLEDNTAASKDSYIGFSYAINNTVTRRAAFYNNSLYLGVAGNLAMITTSGLTADRTFTFPNLSGQLVTQENANIFTAAQTIAAGVGYPIVLYRNTTSTGLGVGVSFELDNSNNSQRQYAAIVGNVLVSTAGAESGALNFQTRNSGTLGTRMQLHSSGNLAIGSDLRLILTQVGLTSTRVMSFPDSDQTLLGRTDTATVTNKTINGLKVNNNAKTAAYTATATDDYIPCDATSAGFTVTLPAVASNTGKIFTIQKTDSSSNTVTIDGNASETINGNITMALTAQYQTVTLYCNGSTWFTSPYSVERRGKSTASGNGSTTVFNVPHGLGSNPHDALIQCSSHTIAFTYTTDATNIVVTFASAPPSGTNNVIFHWSAVP